MLIILSEKLLLLRLLNAAQSQDFRLAVLECLGLLLLQLHWQRGIIDSLVQTRKIKLTKAHKENWDRVIQNLELYESFAWEIAPPRALLLQLRKFRLTGELDEKILSENDGWGRVPYSTPYTDDDLKDIIRQIEDVRKFQNGIIK